MARTKKPEPISIYRHEKTRIEVQVFLDRDTFKYFGEYQGRRHEHKDHGELVKLLAVEIEADSGLTWEPVLHVTVHTHEKSPHLSFSYERFLLCHRNSRGGDRLKRGDMLKCPWSVERLSKKSDEDIAALREKLRRDPIGTGENGNYRIDAYEGLDIPDNLRLTKSQEFHWDSDRSGPFKVPCRPSGWRGVGDEIYVAYDERLWTSLTILHARLDALAKAIKDMFLDPTKLAQLAYSGVALLGLPGGTPETQETTEEKT